jgi:DNA-binding LacI/PurR family transcriptional regulator
MVTIQDVARAAGVSPMTVSNVINDRVPVRAETRGKVIDAIDRLGYQVNVAARILRAGRTGTVGLAVPDLDKPYTGQLAARITRAGQRHGLRVIIEETGARKAAELEAIDLSKLRLYDGLIISAVGLGLQDLAHMHSSTPMVLLGERFSDAGVDHVGMPNVDGARSMVDHLLATGRRRIAVIGAPLGYKRDRKPDELDAAHLRLRGYREALANHAVRYDPALVVEAEAWSLPDGAQGVRKLLQSGTMFDAVFALTDSLALGALRELADLDIPVPTDVAVAGFDDVLESRYSIPRLTTVAPDHEQIADTAMAFMAERIESGDDAGPGRDIICDFQVMVRESTVSPTADARGH